MGCGVGSGDGVAREARAALNVCLARRQWRHSSLHGEVAGIPRLQFGPLLPLFVFVVLHAERVTAFCRRFFERPPEVHRYSHARAREDVLCISSCTDARLGARFAL